MKNPNKLKTHKITITVRRRTENILDLLEQLEGDSSDMLGTLSEIKHASQRAREQTVGSVTTNLIPSNIDSTEVPLLC